MRRGVRLSVVVRIYIHRASLAETLDTLPARPMPTDLAWKVILIDNDPNDDTRAVVERLFCSQILHERDVFEGRQGLSAACNSGLSVASGEVVALTNDDAKVSPDWVLRLHKAC